MANVYYTVVKGDNLTKIAREYNTTVNNLVELNDIENENLIIIGQRLLVSGTKTGTTNMSYKCIITNFGLDASNDANSKKMIATWRFDRTKPTDNFSSYRVVWQYHVGIDPWRDGEDKDGITTKYSTFTPPAEAIKVRVKVIPISKKYKETKNGKSVETAYWTGTWVTSKEFQFEKVPPVPQPSLKIEGTALTVSVDNYTIDQSEYPGEVKVHFELIKNNKTAEAKTKAVTPVTGHAEYTWTIASGQTQYKVRARAGYGYVDINKRPKSVYSEWSSYTDNQSVLPNAPAKITECRAMSEDSVYLKWSKATGATGYEVQYTDTKSRFDTSNQDVQSETYDATVDHAEITGLETGKEYFFRVRATNEGGNSGWTPIKSTTVGSQPGVPTTWSSTTTAITGDPLTLYWVHNAEDGSSQTYANLELIVNGTKQVINIKNTTDEDEKDKTSVYRVDTSKYAEGTQIKWRVQTRGVLAKYSDWSAQRVIDIYAPPTLNVSIKDANGSAFTTLTSFPFTINCVAGPDAQTAIGYHISITNDQEYETVDEYGNFKMVVANSSIYSMYHDVNENIFVDTISASNVSLENGVTYTIKCTVAMDSGLSADSTPIRFTTDWDDDTYWPNMEMSYDPVTATAQIKPFCVDVDGNLIDGLMMSVYRRSYDGKLIEVGKDMPNVSEEWVTDPHPALDLARYRIVAKEASSGRVSFYDPPGLPIGETAAIIQWEEAWTEFDYAYGQSFEPKAWSGSMIKLSYNINVSESNSPDVTVVKYIGREHPVAYYGTHLGEQGSWSMEIPKDDVETLYALRRLKSWMGNVYVREPSGVGYWATIAVQFGQTHRELTIPVTLNITRVEGGL